MAGKKAPVQRRRAAAPRKRRSYKKALPSVVSVLGVMAAANELTGGNIFKGKTKPITDSFRGAAKRAGISPGLPTALALVAVGPLAGKAAGMVGVRSPRVGRIRVW